MIHKKESYSVVKESLLVEMVPQEWKEDMPEDTHHASFPLGRNQVLGKKKEELDFYAILKGIDSFHKLEHLQ